MFRFQIISVGKTKESWLEEAIKEYLKRLQTVAQFEFTWVKSDAQLIQTVAKLPHYVCLDLNGMQFSSEKFAIFVEEQLIKNGSKITFVIGGPEGIPDEVKSKANLLLSFSTLTMTHQMIRLILVEQLYRAFEILKGSQYHK